MVGRVGRERRDKSRGAGRAWLVVGGAVVCSGNQAC